MTIPVAVPLPYRWAAKHQHDITPRSMDFATWLSAIPGDTLATVAATVAPAVYGGLAVASVLIAGTVATVWLAGGVEDQAYMVILTVTATSGRTEDFSIQIAVPAVATILI